MAYTQAEALEALSEDDHAIFSEAEAREIAAAFGVSNVLVPVMRDTRNQFKGATLPGATRPGERVRAIGGVALMYTILAAIGGDTEAGENFMGYGRRYRAKLEALRAKVAAS